MKTHPLRSEIWLADLGMLGKVRPVLVASIAPDDSDRDMISIVPRTTAVRGTRFEVPHQGRGFEPGAFDAQGVASVPAAHLLRRLSVVDGPTLARVEDALRLWLGLA
jgi:mRNA interferase MazF